MAPTRRNRSGSTPSVHSSPQAQRARQQRVPPPVPSPAPEPTQSPAMGMSAMSRYNHNLKVLRRRDPSIVSIFDQFSHVCVYHYIGKKWEKQGFEGTMFLYERDSYPPYGFYILNRVGMDDYIQRLYPEDSMQQHESYLMIRSYPDFTSRRLSMARASMTPQRAEGALSKFAPEFAIPGPEKLPDSDKDASQTVSLWCFATDARDPIQDVMIRLHSYIKRNLPYPEIFRYTPDRPPPTNPQRVTNGVYEEANSLEAISQPQSPANASSSVDALFSKLQSPLEPNGSNSLNESISCTNSESHAPSRGLALLDSIFASASSSALSHATSTQPVPSSSLPLPKPHAAHLPHSQIVSPKPTPQILTQDVISSLLGMRPFVSSSPTSPSSSTALSSSSSRRSGQYQYRYEGDNEDEASDESDGGFSASVSSTSTALNVDVDNNLEQQTAGTLADIPSLLPHEQGGGMGDRTPRPPLRGMDSDGVDYIRTSTPPVLSPLRARTQTLHQSTSQSGLQIPSSSPAFVNASPSLRETLIPSLAKSSSSSTINADFNSKSSKRPLVPFSTDSELWPYPRAPVDDRSNSIENDNVVELDFADTSALSDLRMFQEKEKASKNSKGKGSKESQKKGKKERAEERERERNEIEKSWDVPFQVPPTPPPITVNGKGKTPVKASSLPAVNGTKGAIDSDAIKGSIISVLSSQHSDLKGMPRNDFVKEVLTMIHTDRSFVDKLWREYNLLSR